MPHDINYTGPGDNYIPPPGDNTNGSQFPANLIISPVVTYADVNYLNQIITSLISQTTDLQTTLTTVLQSMSLAVTTDPKDVNLVNAHSVLWPSALGAAPQYITFLYYQSLANNSSAAATALRASYEAAARGVTGNNAIDLLPIVQMTLDEADFIQTFVDAHVGDLSDSSQRRTVELLQDWIESAAAQMVDIQNQYQNQNNAAFNNTDVAQLSATDAANSQAVLQVNMNQINVELGKELGILKQYFANYQSTFYNNVLGPAVSFRNNVTTNLLPTIPPSIYALVQPSTNVLNTQLTSVLADQMRRNTLYVTQVQNILLNVQSRDTYRSYIQQLSSAGQNIPVGTSGTIISATDTPTQASYFQSSTSTTATTNPFLAPHSQLSGLDDPEAHPQYIDRYGDTMLGNLELVATSDISPNGALIDGVKPSTHAHTGEDGTVKLSVVSTDDAGIPIFTGPTAISATAGTIGTLPAQVAGYLDITIGGVGYKIPYYAT